MPESIASLMVNSEKYDLSSGKNFQATFAKQRYIHLQGFYQKAALILLKNEVKRLSEKANRRNFVMSETSETPRILSTLSGDTIDVFSSLIPSLYKDPILCDFFSLITGELLYTVEDPGEKYVLNILHHQGDTHGAHIDSYKYALITAIETPGYNKGGCLELVANNQDINAFDDPNANVVSLCMQDGDCVLLDSSDSIHRVTPLFEASQRIVIASAFANAETRYAVSYSSKKLYGG